MPRFEEQQLFDPELYSGGAITVELPDSILRRARIAARTKLFGMPRYSRTFGTSEEDRGLEFWPTRNAWHEYCGGMGFTMTAEDIAMRGAKTYVSETLGINPGAFNEALEVMAVDLSDEYNVRYPIPSRVLMLEPGY